jgi:hypothetical protein
MGYRLLADAVLILHLGFIAFVVLGGLIVLRWLRIAWLHLPAVVGAPGSSSRQHLPARRSKSACARGGETTYRGGFIEHYVTALIYPEGLNRSQQMVLGAFVLVLNAAVYGWLLWRRRRGRQPR